MERRDFLWILGGGVVAFEIGCLDSRRGPPGTRADTAGTADHTDELPDAAADGCHAAFVKMHDSYGLSFDGSLGAVADIEVAFVLAGTTITLELWHGHQTMLHRCLLGPRQFDSLSRGDRITLPASVVGDCAHTLVIDPTAETYRVGYAPDVDVPVGPCM